MSLPVAAPTFFPAPAVDRTAPLGTIERPLPLIIDSDPGLDDALAIGLAAELTDDALDRNRLRRDGRTPNADVGIVIDRERFTRLLVDAFARLP